MSENTMAINRFSRKNRVAHPEDVDARRQRAGGRRLALTAGLGLAALLAGCMTVGPDYKPPRTEVPAKWVGPQAAAVAPAERALANWWTAFQDPVLTSLVKRAVTSNLDLKQAEARIRQARASRGIAGAGLGPTLDASGSYQRSRSSGRASSSSAGVIGNQYQAGFDAGWELDIFGGIRRGVEAADADLTAAVEDRHDVLVTLAAEVARNYVDLRTYQQRVVIGRRNLKAQQQTALLTRQRFTAGFVSGLDVANAEAEVATTAAQIPPLESAARQTIYNLGVLLGREPAALLQELSPELDIPVAPPAAPAGVPADLLRRRPDIRRAEAQIHAATARIGVATADLFPKFSIGGSAGFLSNAFGGWFDWISRFWSIGPSVGWSVFDSGRIRSNIELQKALEEQSLITYRQTVLTALQEVEKALIASQKEQEHRLALVTAVAANRRAVALSKQLYAEGQTDFLNVLQA